jgi:hypothetical protein
LGGRNPAFWEDREKEKPRSKAKRFLLANFFVFGLFDLK